MSEKTERVEDRLADFTRDRRILLLSVFALVIGCVSAFVAYTLVWLISVITGLAFFQRFSTELLSPARNGLGPFVIAVPAVGGLVIGLLARYGSERIRGHGIPEALEAILFGRSRMSAKVAVLKPLSSAISIGTGGPFGAEGPIIMTGGAIGSLFAQMFHLSAAERRTLLVAGAAGGMAAIFGAPVSAVLLAVELLLFEWRPRSFIPVTVAAAVAATLRVPLLGPGPVFPVHAHAPLGAEALVITALVGVAAGLASGLLTTLVYASEDLFERLPIHWMWWPAIGGILVGLGGYFDPRVLGVGYDTIHSLLRGEILGAAVVGLLIGKSLVWSVALGSGTSGGVLAPLLMMGGALGALASGFLPVGDAGLWATIGMAAMMGGTMRSPLTAMVFTLELTSDFNLFPALLVGEVMDENPPTVAASMKVAELSDLIAHRDPKLTRRQGIPVVDDEGRLAGIITRGDVLRAIEQGADADTTVLDAGSRRLVVAYADELLHEAVNKMLRNDIGRLPVVLREDPHRLVGYLGRASVMAARLRRLEEEHVREQGLSFNAT